MGVEAAIIGAAIAGAATSYYQGEKQEKAQEAASRDASSLAQQQAKQAKDAQARALNESRAAEQSANRTNRRTPGTAGSSSTAGGNASTLLTGPMGVDPGMLQLGKTTLLGG
jgi:hypothetical protein